MIAQRLGALMVIEDVDDPLPGRLRRETPQQQQAHHRRGLAALLLDLLQADDLTQTVVAERSDGKVMVIHVHPELVTAVDFASVLDAFQSLSAGERIVWMAIAAGILRVRPGRWEQRTHANGKPRRYTEEEVSRHYSMGRRTVYKAWMKADNVMGRAFDAVSWQFKREEYDH